MITITRSVARQLRNVLRRAKLLKGPHGRDIGLRFSTGPEGLCLAAACAELAIEYRQPGALPVSECAIAADTLTRLEGRDDSPVTFTLDDATWQVTIRWTDRGVANQDVVPTLNIAELPPVPKAPERWTDSEPRLIPAFRDAMATRDSGSTRFAFDCVQARGTEGELVASDSRQLLVQRGFQFPWREELLLWGTDVFASRELLGHDGVRIGRTDKVASIQTGPWTVHLAFCEGRFANVQRVIPAETAVKARLQLTAADAEFLANSLSGLPTCDALNDPVTMDLNGAVAIRGHSTAESSVSELVLSNSQRTGDEIRVGMNRQYLARAMVVGFHELQLTSDEAPVVCRDANRIYLWAVLDRDVIVPPTESALRSSSPMERAATTPAMPVNRIANRVRASDSTEQQRKARPSGRKQRPVATPDVIIRTLELRTQLREVVQGLGELVRQIRQQRKQSRLAKTTLAAIKQLQTLDV